jgi:hypothetical protein
MMVVHKNPRWERSLELVELEVAAMERCRANPFLILAELNDAMLELMMVSMRREREIEKEKFLGELRKILNAGRRDL